MSYYTFTIFMNLCNLQLAIDDYAICDVFTNECWLVLLLALFSRKIETYYCMSLLLV